MDWRIWYWKEVEERWFFRVVLGVFDLQENGGRL
jgi:hypothetical protein